MTLPPLPLTRLAAAAVAVAGAAALSCASAPTTVTAADASAAAAGGPDLRAAAKAQLGDLAHAASAFEMQNGHCPGGVEDVAQPAPNDPWGNPIAFMPAGPENPTTAFISAGPDGQLLTADDITAPVNCSER